MGFGALAGVFARRALRSASRSCAAGVAGLEMALPAAAPTAHEASAAAAARDPSMLLQTEPAWSPSGSGGTASGDPCRLLLGEKMEGPSGRPPPLLPPLSDEPILAQAPSKTSEPSRCMPSLSDDTELRTLAACTPFLSDDIDPRKLAMPSVV